MTTFQTLPLEILTKVLSFLPTVEDVVNVAITNRLNYKRVQGSESHIVPSGPNQPTGRRPPHHLCHPPRRRDCPLEKVTEFGEHYHSKQATELLLPARAFSLKMASSILPFDDCAFRIAERIAAGILADADTDLTYPQTYRDRPREAVEALEPVVARREFPAAWEDLYATLKQEDHNAADNRRYEKITEATYEDYFRRFDLPAFDQSQGSAGEYETTVDTLDIDGCDAADDTAARDAWLWQVNRFSGIFVADPVFAEAEAEGDVGDMEYSPHQVLWWDRERMEEMVEIPSFEDMMEVLKENVLPPVRE
ncbi:hypothetical protein DL766_001846 [Monosporascus sp. MC13-8B]|uniref:F-box domain-containing protein n=1 Tax=Monosporascus cannonballus TaxID=155416 RepID=A0ABY0H856_9PEZI|nr:hypothetical protein DL762_005817 [Monosporascus cannonballus]RYO99156.1 hypothetical protein DL763_001646 [Monosporascus cannonballus]RYP36729.1 hypothetical protein DL766_001846 [Monosporascus sp. MC13-8B]